MINILSFNIPHWNFQKNNNSFKIKILVLEGFGGVPPIRPLETLHNALSLRQLDTFLEKMTTTTIFKTPASSPPKYPSTPLLTPTQTPHNSLTEKPGPMTCKLRKDVKNEEAEQKLPETDDANSFWTKLHDQFMNPFYWKSGHHHHNTSFFLLQYNLVSHQKSSTETFV